MTRRRGVSLMELLVVMSIGMVVLVLSAVLIGRAMQAESRSRRFNDVERNAWRLAESFRRDAHQAQSSALVDPAQHAGTFLELTLPADESIEYSKQNGVVQRVLLQGGNIKGRETFTFPAYVEVKLHEQFEPRRLELTLLADPNTTPRTTGNQPWNQYATRASLRTEAILGRDSRYATATPRAEVPQ